jgi:GNAT superfamily N-acetyltransferase
MPATSQQNDRLGDTRAMLNVLKHGAREGKTVLTYYDGDQSVGLASVEARHEPWSNARYLAISAMVTHPRTRGIGRKIIKQAIQVSWEQGCGGELRLDPLNDNARNAFRKLGFTDDGIQMVLHTNT